MIKNKEQMTPGIDTNMPALPDITLLKKLLRSEVDMLASIKNNFQVFIFLCFVEFLLYILARDQLDHDGVVRIASLVMTLLAGGFILLCNALDELRSIKLLVEYQKNKIKELENKLTV